MRRTYRRKKWKPDKTTFKANLHIRAPEVRVIDHEGKMIGVMPFGQALAKAQEQGLDLVEVNPTAQPPIVKFVDYGKFQYEQEKIKQKQKAKIKKVEVKGIRLTMRIGDHDRLVRLNQAQKFFEKGDKVRIELVIRGREHAFTRDGIAMVNQFISDLKASITDELVVENYAKKEGNAVTALLSTTDKKKPGSSATAAKPANAAAPKPMPKPAAKPMARPAPLPPPPSNQVAKP